MQAEHISIIEDLPEQGKGKARSRPAPNIIRTEPRCKHVHEPWTPQALKHFTRTMRLNRFDLDDDDETLLDRGTTDDNYSCTSDCGTETAFKLSIPVLRKQEKASRHKSKTHSVTRVKLQDARILAHQNATSSDDAQRMQDSLPAGAQRENRVENVIQDRSPQHIDESPSASDSPQSLPPSSTMTMQGNDEGVQKANTVENEGNQPEHTSESSDEFWEQLPNWRFVVGTRRCSKVQLAKPARRQSSRLRKEGSGIMKADKTGKRDEAPKVGTNFDGPGSSSDYTDSEVEGCGEVSYMTKPKQQVRKHKCSAPPRHRKPKGLSTGVKQATIQEQQLKERTQLMKERARNETNESETDMEENTETGPRIEGDDQNIQSVNLPVESIAPLYFKKPIQVTENTRHAGQSKKKIKAYISECRMCSTTYKYYGDTPTELTERHLCTKHNVQDSKTQISRENKEKMKANQEYLQRRRPNMKPSVAWDFFIRRNDEWNAVHVDCLLCDFSASQSATKSTGAMLNHLHVDHKHMRLPYTCYCNPRCKMSVP